MKNYLLFLILFLVACSPVVRKEVPLPLSFSDVVIEGDLAERIKRNFDRLEGPHYRPYEVFCSDSGNEGWPGDQEGRTLLGLVMDARASRRTPLYLDSIMLLYPLKLNAARYLGPVYRGKASEQQLSGHGWLLRGLCEYFLWKKDTKALEYIRWILDSLALPTTGLHKKYPLDPSLRKITGGMAGTTVDSAGHWYLSSDIGCNFIFLDGLIQAAELTGRKDLLPLIREMTDQYLKMDVVKIHAQTHATLTGIRALLRLYAWQKDTLFLHEARKKFSLYVSEGMTENYENYNWFGRPEWTEPCAVVDAYMAAVQLWQYTGDISFLEMAHLIYYNGLCYEQRHTGSFGNSSCSGAGECRLTARVDDIYWCCNMRGAEGLASAVRYQAFTLPSAIVFAHFENGKYIFRFGDDSMVMKETSLYPYSGKVYFEVESSHLAVDPEIRLFAPSWIDQPVVTVNGNIAGIKLNEGFVCFTYELKEGDVIEYTFKIKSRSLPVQNKHSIHPYHKYLYGPLLMAYAGKDSLDFYEHVTFEPITKDLFRVKDRDLFFRPVCHVMNPLVKNGFSMQVLFRDKE